jgi:hypothetical protein
MNFKEDLDFEIIKEEWKTRGSNNFTPNESVIRFDQSKSEIGICFIPAPGKIHRVQFQKLFLVE